MGNVHKKNWCCIGLILAALTVALVAMLATQVAVRAQETVAPPTQEELASAEAISKVFRHVAQKVRPAVVHIETTREYELRRPVMPQMRPRLPRAL